MGVGRPPHPSEVVDLVRCLLTNDRLSPRAIVRQLESRRIRISRASVRQIRDGSYRQKRDSTATLAPGEARMSTAIICQVCGNPINVAPCRVCKARAFFARVRQIAGSRGVLTGVRTRRRFNPPDPQLTLELHADEDARRQEILARRQN